jgi:hypothetical protein
MKQVWQLTKSEFNRAVTTEGPEGDGFRREIAVRYGIVDYDYIIRHAISHGISVEPTIRKYASVRSPSLIRVQAYGERAARSMRSIGESVSRFLFE